MGNKHYALTYLEIPVEIAFNHKSLDVVNLLRLVVIGEHAFRVSYRPSKGYCCVYV